MLRRRKVVVVRTRKTQLFAVPAVPSRSSSAVLLPDPASSVTLQMLTWLDDAPATQKAVEQAPISESAERSTIPARSEGFLAQQYPSVRAARSLQVYGLAGKAH